MKTSKVTVADLDLCGKKVLMRVDFNVPIEQGVITDDTRIVAALPTIRYVLEKGCPLILMSHWGRPKGRRNDALSLRPVASRLAEKLGSDVKVKMAPDWIGQEVEDMAAALQSGEILMLENTRFHAVEEGKDGVLEDKAKKLAEAGKPEAEEAKQAAAEAKKRLKAEQPDVARQLAAMADVYVNDAFGAAHRRHVSTAIVAEYAKKTAIGLLMKAELAALNRVLTGDVERPMIAVVGGAKVSDKLEVLQSFLGRMDAILIGGGMIYTFLLAQNQDIGRSIHEKDLVDTAKDILKQAGTEDERGRKQADLLLPVDHVEAACQTSAARLEAWLAAEQSSPSHQAVKVEEALGVAEALQTLPDRQREAVVLYYWEGCTLAEVGESLACTTAAAGGLLRRGLETLRQRLPDAT